MWSENFDTCDRTWKWWHSFLTEVLWRIWNFFASRSWRSFSSFCTLSSTEATCLFFSPVPSVTTLFTLERSAGWVSQLKQVRSSCWATSVQLFELNFVSSCRSLAVLRLQELILIGKSCLAHSVSEMRESSLILEQIFTKIHENKRCHSFFTLTSILPKSIYVAWR